MSRPPRYPWATPKDIGDLTLVATALVELVRASETPVAHRVFRYARIFLAQPRLLPRSELTAAELEAWDRGLGAQAQREVVIGEAATYMDGRFYDALFAEGALVECSIDESSWTVARGPRFEEHKWSKHYAGAWMAGRVPLSVVAAERFLARGEIARALKGASA